MCRSFPTLSIPSTRQVVPLEARSFSGISRQESSSTPRIFFYLTVVTLSVWMHVYEALTTSSLIESILKLASF
jgi:hypothetical protein